MKKLLAAAVIGVMVSGAAVAGPFGGGGCNGQPNFEKMASWMNVAPENREAFIDVMKAQHDKRIELRDQHRDNLKELKADTAAKLEGLVTAEQLEQFKSREFGKGRGHKGGHWKKAKFADCAQ